ncbi:hypothetical protein SAMN03159448_01180 [Sinorhizobium sp. NFACC03]|nr:hypothetical protein SAMN03159448_01180 [Sinorhizobium sp. NFACC03]
MTGKLCLDLNRIPALEVPDVAKEIEIALLRTIVGHIRAGLFPMGEPAPEHTAHQRGGRIQITTCVRGKRSGSVFGLVPSMIQRSPAAAFEIRASISCLGRSLHPGNQKNSRSIARCGKPNCSDSCRESVLLPLPEQPITRIRCAFLRCVAASSQLLMHRGIGSPPPVTAVR